MLRAPVIGFISLVAASLFSINAQASIIGGLDVDPCCGGTSELGFLIDQGILTSGDDFLGKIDFDDAPVTGDGLYDATEQQTFTPAFTVQFEVSNSVFDDDGNEFDAVDLLSVIKPTDWTLLGVLVVDGRDQPIDKLGTWYSADMLPATLQLLDANLDPTGKGISHISAFGRFSVVPVPPAALMLLTALAGFGVVLRRRGR